MIALWKRALIAMAAVYLINRALGPVYAVWPDIDVPLHVLGGFLAAMLGIGLWAIVRERSGVRNLPPEAAALFAVCFAVTIAVLWEFHEMAMDLWHAGAGDTSVGRMQPSPLDTMKDLANGLLGACLAVIAFRKEL